MLVEIDIEKVAKNISERFNVSANKKTMQKLVVNFIRNRAKRCFIFEHHCPLSLTPGCDKCAHLYRFMNEELGCILIGMKFKDIYNEIYKEILGGMTIAIEMISDNEYDITE